MTIQQSSVLLAKQLWYSSQWRRLQALSLMNQEALGGPSAGGQPQKLRYFANKEHALFRHQKGLLSVGTVICQILCNSPSAESISAMRLQKILISIN